MAGKPILDDARDEVEREIITRFAAQAGFDPHKMTSEDVDDIEQRALERVRRRLGRKRQLLPTRSSSLEDSFDDLSKALRG